MKLIAFDWDQTLWNSWDVHVMALQRAADMLKLPTPSKAYVASIFSVPFARGMERLFGENTPDATKLYMDFYHSRVRELGHLFEGVTEMLEALKGRGYLLALMSDKRDVHGNRELKSTGIDGLFDNVLFLSDGRPYKPDPQGLSQVMDALSVRKEEVLYIGDSHVDVQCAKRTGVAGGAALWGSVNTEAVLKEEPDYSFSKVSDVFVILAL